MNLSNFSERVKRLIATFRARSFIHQTKPKANFPKWKQTGMFGKARRAPRSPYAHRHELLRREFHNQYPRLNKIRKANHQN